jgi:hypothetical protein
MRVGPDAKGPEAGESHSARHGTFSKSFLMILVQGVRQLNQSYLYVYSTTFGGVVAMVWSLRR